MYWTVSDITHIFRVDRNAVKKWAYEFKDYLSSYANPEKGKERKFISDDVDVFAYVYEYWEKEPDYVNIKIGLNQENHKERRYREVAYFSSPIFQEIPEGLGESMSQGILLNGSKVNSPIEVARAYKYATEILIDEALKFDVGHTLDYPIFFAFRHCFELYLKLIGDIKGTHSFARCVMEIEKKYGVKVGGIVKKWLSELEAIDGKGTAFRYADDESLKEKEYWVDLFQLKSILNKFGGMCEEIFWENIKA